MFGTLVPRRSGLGRTEPRTGLLDEFEDAMSRIWDMGGNGWTFGAVAPLARRQRDRQSSRSQARRTWRDGQGDRHSAQRQRAYRHAASARRSRKRRARRSIASNVVTGIFPVRSRCPARFRRTRLPPSIATACSQSRFPRLSRPSRERLRSRVEGRSRSTQLAAPNCFVGDRRVPASTKQGAGLFFLPAAIDSIRR